MELLGNSVVEMLDDIARQARESPQGVAGVDLLALFTERWVQKWVSMWKYIVSAPAWARLEAAAVWEVLEEQMLAGLEVAALWTTELLKKAIDERAAEHAAGSGPQRSRALEDFRTRLVERMDQRPGKFNEAVVRPLEKHHRELVTAVLQVLPEERTWLKDFHERNRVICAFRRDAPITAIVAWRFVVEMQRCRRWRDPSIDRELNRLAKDFTSHIQEFWEGMVWVGSMLWGYYWPFMEEQAKREGKISRHEAELNSKRHLRTFQLMLDKEATAVEAIREREER